MQPESRTHKRVTVSGLRALIAQPSGDETLHVVVNVSEYGMLIDSLTIPAGTEIDFVLEDWPNGYAGRGHIAHRTGHAAGVAVDHWLGVEDVIRALVEGEGPRFQPEHGYVSEWSVVSSQRALRPPRELARSPRW